MLDLVSICIPVYNCEKYIVEAINSVINQTYKNIEILIIDNCSTDNTLNIIKSISDKRIRLIVNDKNLGMVGNWNKCVNEAKGKYIILLCADDRLESNCVEEKLKMFNINENMVLCSSATNIINDLGNIKFLRCNINKTRIIDGKKIFFRSLRTYNIFGEPSNNMFKKNIAKKVGLFNDKLRYYPDWELWLKMSLLGIVGYIKKPLVDYRVSSSNATNNLMKEKELLDKEQKIFFTSLSKYIDISNSDKTIHKINQFFRYIIRRIVMRFINYRV